MNFIEAIRSGFNNYFNFKGRASKSAFWYFLLFEFIYFFIAGFLLGMVGVNDDIFAIATMFLVLPIAIPGIAVTARRIHDFGKSGWMQCIFIPGFVIDEFLGTRMVIWFVTFVIFAIYCSQNGTHGKNKFGTKPKK